MATRKHQPVEEVVTPINAARIKLATAQEDVRQVFVKWDSDPNRAATDISINRLAEAHLLIASAISAFNHAQAHTEE